MLDVSLLGFGSSSFGVTEAESSRVPRPVGLTVIVKVFEAFTASVPRWAVSWLPPLVVTARDGGDPADRADDVGQGDVGRRGRAVIGDDDLIGRGRADDERVGGAVDRRRRRRRG